jgi:hypothetical protein
MQKRSWWPPTAGWVAGVIAGVLTLASAGSGSVSNASTASMNGVALRVTGQFAKVDLLIVPNTTVAPPTVLVGLNVMNLSKAVIPFRFSSSERFDIELRNSKNRVVARWSKGQAFAQIVSTENLAAGQKWHFQGRLRMPLNLRGGDYTLRIYLTADKRPAAESSLHVTVRRFAASVP